MKLKLVFLLAFFNCLGGNIFAQNYERLVENIKNGSVETKRETLYQIRNLATEEASRIAVSALQDSDEIVRATATQSVIYLPSVEAAQLLLPLLQDNSIIVRKETIYALGKTHNQRALNPLLKILDRDKELEIRMASAVALGEIGDVSAIEVLIKILQKKPKEAEDFLRRATARSVGQIAQFQQVKSNYAVTPESLLDEKYDTFANLKYSNLAENNQSFKNVVYVLLKVLQSQKESDDVRRETAFALGAIGDRSVIPILQNTLNAKDYYLAEICKESLAKLDSHSFN